MECQEMRELMSAWLDGELDKAMEAALSAHLNECEACRQEWQKLRALESALGRLAAPAPPGLTEKVLERVKPRRRQWVESLALAACLVLGIALGGTMAQSFYTPVSSPAETDVSSLEVFQDFPQGSLGTIVASYQPDEVNGNLQ
ncbi:MAG: zf-HC2 domain-containing protein [Thermodesulfobacteriota bacterium]